MRIPMQPILISVPAVLLVATGCGASNTPDAVDTHAAPAAQTAQGGDVVGSAKPVGRSADTIVVPVEESLIRQFFLPSLSDMAADPYVTAVVEGTVVDAQTKVDEVNTVYTVLTVKVIRGGGLRAGSTILVTEGGGIVPMRKVRSDFEGKQWQKPLTPAELNRLIDFKFQNFTHTKIGDQLVMLLAKTESPFGLLLKLAPNGNSGTYSWPGGLRPNPEWKNHFTGEEIDGLFEIPKPDLTATTG